MKMPQSKTRVYRCMCSHPFLRPSRLELHEKSCAARPIIIELRETVELQRVEIERQRAENERLWARVGSIVGPVGATVGGGSVVAAVAIASTAAAPSMAVVPVVAPPPPASIRTIGHTSYESVTPLVWSDAIKNPKTATSKIFRFIRRDPSNRNVLIPNIRDKRAKVFTVDGWVNRDRKTMLGDIAQAIADKITDASDSDAVRAVATEDAIDRWVAHHELLINNKKVMEVEVNQLDEVILSGPR